MFQSSVQLHLSKLTRRAKSRTSVVRILSHRKPALQDRLSKCYTSLVYNTSSRLLSSFRSCVYEARRIRRIRRRIPSKKCEAIAREELFCSVVIAVVVVFDQSLVCDFFVVFLSFVKKVRANVVDPKDD